MPTETIFYTKFSFEIILLKIVSEICQVLCSYTRGVIGISEDWGNFGEKAHLPTEKRCEPGWQVHFSIVAAILLAALGVNQRDHILYTCARTGQHGKLGVSAMI